ncbi:MAG: methylmalonyl-CoA mutase [Actinomycetia bacterium]|nr:methylmalonyl-CoA mutase [Actinomycetes bacterium]
MVPARRALTSGHRVGLCQLPASTLGGAVTDPIRVLVTKIGLDGHDRGSRIVATYLRDAGHEVIYTPPWQEIDAVVALAVQEDVDVIGVSSLATDHLIIPDLITALRAAEMAHVGVVVGGIIPATEHQLLTDAGVDAIFGPGSSRAEIVASVEALGNRVHEQKLSSGEFAS